MARKFYAPAPFTILVAGPNGRTSFTNQIIMDSSGNNRIGLFTGNPSPATLQITISDANFATSIQAEGTITPGAPIALDTVVIGGVTLVGVAAVRTSGLNDFNVGAVNVADEIAAAINDVGNDFVADVVAATSDGAIVTVTAVPVGELGNLITMVSSTVELVISGAALTGGITAGESTLYLGEYEITTNLDWVPVEGNANASATALAAAIDLLPDFTASALAADVTVEGPTGASEIPIWVVYEGTGGNYTLTPNTDTISGGPTVGPPVIG